MSLLPCRSVCEKFSKYGCATPSADKLLTGPNRCSKLPVVNCVNETYIPDYGMYRGAIRDIEYYDDALTDREVQKEMTGKLPPLPVKSECLCPSDNPTAVTSLLCSNPTDSFQSATRLGDDLHVPEAINDKNWPEFSPNSLRTAWFSKSNIDELTIIVKFTQRQMVYNITYELPFGEYPGLFAENTTVQLLDGGSWRTIAYITTNCTPFTGEIFLERGPLISLRQPVCVTVNPFIPSVHLNLVLPRAGVSYNKNGGMAIHPTVQQFLTGTAIRFRLDGHQEPKNRFYGIANIGVSGWNISDDACECFGAGLAPGVIAPNLCNSENQCYCRKDAGDPSVTSHTCYPYTVDGEFEMVPNYGPESGGTLIAIHGGFFGNGTVKVSYGGQFDFEVLNVNETLITCKSPNVSGTIELYKPLPVKITLYDGSENTIMLVLDEKFEYREDPIIESITPLSTFLKGGINQTVTGQYIDSVFAPILTVTIIYRDGNAVTSFPQPPSVCTVTNSTQMICKSPEVINLPDEYIRLLTDSASDASSRKKRAANNAVINRNDFQFYVGFVLDGLKRYNNLSEELPEYGIIDVYVNPDIHSWKEGDKIKLFQPYKGDSHILIEGERLTYGCTIEDYVVSIGEEICTVNKLFINTLQCSPPSSEPDLGVFHKNGAPAVTAKVGNIEEFVGYLQYHETAWDDPVVKGSILGVLIGIIVIVIIVVVVVVMKKKQANKMKDKEMNKYSEPPTPWTMLPASVKTELEPCMKPSDSLKLGRKCGEGNFGKVFIGSFTDEKGSILVAAKSVKDKGCTTKELLEFLEEATLMKDFKHENVLHLVGVVLQDDRPFVLLPLMENGDLRTFILNPQNQFTVADLLDFGLQVTHGMCYLSTLKFVHRDLAARNCMVNKENQVKVADFGLARDIYSNEYYRVENKSRPLPVKWMAPEALDDFKFTTKSDVWSYGVLLWELLTRGKKPYSHVDNFQLKQYLKSGNRLDKPSSAPDDVYELMLQCWNMNPKSRPSFDEIEHELTNLLSENDETETIKTHGSTSASPGEGYQDLKKYVDQTTDRHGYEHLHEEQGYLDMSNQVDYIEAAKELGLDGTCVDNDGYLAPIESRPSAADSGSGSTGSKSKPKPKPRKHVGSNKSTMQEYQNVSFSNNDEKSSSHKKLEVDADPADIDVVEVPPPQDNERDSNIPLYMNAASSNVQYVNIA